MEKQLEFRFLEEIRKQRIKHLYEETQSLPPITNPMSECMKGLLQYEASQVRDRY